MQKEYLCKRGDEEQGFTAAEFKMAQADGWEKQYQYKVGKKKVYMLETGEKIVVFAFQFFIESLLVFPNVPQLDFVQIPMDYCIDQHHPTADRDGGVAFLLQYLHDLFS